MSIMALFQGFKCPECGQMIMASEIKGTHEPGLSVTTCQWCGTEIQVMEDKVTGKMKAEKKPKPS